MTLPARETNRSSTTQQPRVLPAPAADWEALPIREPKPYRLQREQELPALLRQRADPNAADPESPRQQARLRPTQLATRREEERQIQAISRVVCQATMECLAGVRPLHQMQRWLDDAVYAKVAEFSDLTSHVRHEQSGRSPRNTPFSRAHPVQFLRIRSQGVTSLCWEVSVVFRYGPRVRCCALRLEARRRQWRVVALEIG